MHRRADAGRAATQSLRYGPDRAGRIVPRPGGDRDRERAPVQRDQGSARAADGDRGDPQGDQRVADRRATGVRFDRAECCESVWLQSRNYSPRGKIDRPEGDRGWERDGRGNGSAFQGNEENLSGAVRSRAQPRVACNRDGLDDRDRGYRGAGGRVLDRQGARQGRRFPFPDQRTADPGGLRHRSHRTGVRAAGRPLERQAAHTGADLCRPGGDRDRERAPVQGAGGAHRSTDEIRRPADRARRGEPDAQLDARPRQGAADDRLAGRAAVRSRRRRDLRIRRGTRGVQSARRRERAAGDRRAEPRRTRAHR